MRRLLILLFVALPTAVYAADPAVDSTSSAGNGFASSLTFSHTVSGSNRYLACGVAVQNPSRTVTSITFNGVALTSLASENNDTDPTRQSRAEYWYLIAPDATTANVVVTISSATAVAAGCVSLTGVHQTSPHGTPATSEGDGATTNVDVASMVGSLVLDVTSIRVGTTTITQGAGQTQYVNQLSASGVGNATLGMSAEAGASTTSMGWTVDDATPKVWTAIGVSLNGIAGSGSTHTVCALNCDFTNSQLQSALDASADGDTILLETAHPYPSPGAGWIMGDKCAVPVWNCITIRTGVTASGVVMPRSSFPPDGVRPTAADALVFAKMNPTTNNEAALRTVYPGETGSSCSATPCVANGWTAQWIEFTPKLDWAQRALVRFGTSKAGKEFQGGVWVNTLPGGETQDTLVEVPQYLSLIQCYVRGDPFIGQHQGVYLSSKDARILSNVIIDIKSLLETQAITGINGTGPYQIENNLIAATGENVIWGGGDTYLRLKATVSGTPSTTSVQLSTPLWDHLDGTTEAAGLSACTSWPCAPGQDIYSRIFISLTHGGVDYGGIECTFSGSTCTFPALPFTPSVGDTVRWVWLMGGLTFKSNHLLKNLEWFSPIVPTLTGVTAVASSGGSLTAGTYCYRVVAHAFASGSDPTVFSTPTTEQCATAGASGRVTISWSPNVNAQTYRVYGRTSGGQNQFWTVTAPTTSYVDTGSAGTGGSPPSSGTIWPVKNNFESKQGDGAAPMGPILVEGNVIDRAWCCSQNNIVSIKVNNQNAKDVSVTIRNWTFRNNWIRHGNRALALTCTTTGNASPQSPSGPMTNVTITNNLWTDMSSAWVNTSGTVNNSAILVSTGSYANEVGSKGCVGITMTHNTFLYDSNDMNGPLWFNLNTSTDKMVDFVLRDNIMARDCITTTCINNGNRTIKTFAPNNLGNNAPVASWTGAVTGSSVASYNAFPDGTSTQYTSGTFPNALFPTDAAVKATHLANYSACLLDLDISGCALLDTSSLHNAGSDGTDIGANIAAIKAFTDAAVGGASSGEDTPPDTTGHGTRSRLRIR